MTASASRALCWRRITDNNSLEYAAARPVATGVELAGTIVSIHQGTPLQVYYEIQCDPHWRTRAVWVEQQFGLKESALALYVDEKGYWTDQEGNEIHSLAGCLDVDLELTPITNTLPINRLNLAVGQQEEITVAWIRFPSLEIIRARQSYERLGDRTYRYCSLQSGFTADIDVDEIGLTIRYRGIWERIAVA